MKRFKLIEKETQTVVGEFDSVADAQAYIIDLVLDEGDISIFDYAIEEVEYGDPSKTIQNYEAACNFLNREGAIVTYIPNKHRKAISAMYTLITIAEDWNKADNFIPDFSNRNQYKYFPWFVYDNDTAGFVYANTNFTAVDASTLTGSRLCFKTEKRATQFGKQFIELWNDFLLFR